MRPTQALFAGLCLLGLAPGVALGSATPLGLAGPAPTPSMCPLPKGSPGPAGQTLDYQLIDRTLESKVVKPAVAIIRNLAELQRFWRANVPAAKSHLAVDFDKELLYAFFSGRGGQLMLPASVELYPQWLTISLPPAEPRPIDAQLDAPAWLMRLPRVPVSQFRIQGAGVVESLR